MAAFDFPNSPSVNDTYSANGSTYTWNGTKWVRTSPSVGAQGHQGATGGTGATGAQGATGSGGATGAQGATGSGGSTGAQGAEGNFGGATFYYTFEANTTDANPGAGDLRLDNSTQNAATGIYICDTDEDGTDIASYLQTIDDSTSTIKGHVKITNKLDSSQFLLFTISSLTDNTGYFDITVSPIDSSATSPFSANEDILITFARTGDKGDTGAQGATGSGGSTGAQGATGSTGAQGAQGHQGATGGTGAQGALATINNNTNNYVVTATGTANTLNGEANLTFSGSQLKIDADSPQFLIEEADTTTTSRFVMSGGRLYIQVAQSGQGTSTSSGIMYLTGYNNTTASEIHLKANNTYNTGHFHLDDNDYLKIGNSDDLQLFHDGSHSFLKHNGEGDFYVQTTEASVEDLYLQAGNDVYIRVQTGETAIKAIGNGAVELYHDNIKKFETISSGVQVSGTLFIPDGGQASNRISIGNSGDLQIFHDGNNSIITAGGAGDLQLTSTVDDIEIKAADNIFIRPQGGEEGIKVMGDGAVELYHDNSKKLHTQSGGVNVEGQIVIDHTGGTDGKGEIAFGESGRPFIDGFDNGNHGSGAGFDFRAGNGDYFIRTRQDAAVELYHNNTKRIETTANGIYVTGSGTGNFFNAGANALNTTFQSSFGGAGATSVIRVKMNTSSVHGIQIQQAGSGTAVAGGNHAATFFNTENAKLRLGTNNVEQFRIENNGDLKANDTSISSLSDSRLKKNIVDFTYDLSKFKQFRPRTFDWINPELHGDKSEVRGFVAQEIETIDSKLVGEYGLYDETLTDKNPDLEIIKADDGTNIAKDAKLGTNDAMYISVIQQLMTKIETLETENTDLKNLIKNSSSFAALKSSL